VARSQGFGTRAKRPGIIQALQVPSTGSGQTGTGRSGTSRARSMLVAYFAALAFCIFGLPVIASAFRPLDQLVVQKWGPPQQKHQVNRY
jgi:hypothetical protein